MLVSALFYYLAAQPMSSEPAAQLAVQIIDDQEPSCSMNPAGRRLDFHVEIIDHQSDDQDSLTSGSGEP